MALCAQKLFVLVAIFQVISRERSQVVAWFNHTMISPSATFEASTNTQTASVSSYCNNWQFRCNNGQCVYGDYQCDGYRDCSDGSDESHWNCTSSVLAFQTLAITPSPTTQTASVSSYCNNWQFRCNNGQCVSGNWLCDGYPDCSDGSDESQWNCTSSLLASQTQVVEPSSTTVLASQTQVVAPSSTMQSQVSFSANHCYYGQFRCGDGQCIDHSRVCNGGYPDCRDGSDEKYCSSGNSSKCQSKVDLGFILDSSGSVPFNDFQKMKAFVKDLTNFFTISSDETRVSVMTFASSAAIHFHFSSGFSNKNSLDAAVDNIGYTGGGTATALALNFAYTHMFNSRYGARGEDVKKVLIILTDGQSNSGMVSGPARQLKNSGVVIFSVGIGSRLSTHELHAMASEPTGEHVIQLNNFFQLSTLAEQMSAKTCNASHFLVFCNNDAMTAVFKRADLPKHVNVDQLYLRDVRCKASYNSTHVFINTALTGCGTLYKETEQMMFFTNTLSERSLNAPGGAVISRNYLFEANFTCSYGRKRTVGTFSFEPAKQRLFVNLEGGGNFTFAMDFYKSSFFAQPYTFDNYPVFKRLSDFIYIQYSINTSSADLVVHAETCRATPTNRPYDNPQYVFIANGCDNDTTILHFGNGMSSIQRFSIQAFRFLTQHRFVYIHCDLVVCNRNYPDSTCARGNSCSRRRYRRGVNNMSSSDDSSRMYALSSGPLMYSAESGGEKSTGDPDSKANYSMIGSIVGVGGIALVLAGALVFVIKRAQLRKVSPAPSITHDVPEKAEASA